MKAVPKVGLDGLYKEDVLEGDSFTGVVPIYAQPEPEQTPELPEVVEPVEEDPDAPEEPEPEQPREIIGYVVGIPLALGLYHPRFDLVAWEAYLDEEREALAEYEEAVAEAWKDYQEALETWDEQGDPPEMIYPDKPFFSIIPSDFWVEGLTPEEIAELTKPPEPTEIEYLQSENAVIAIELAITQSRLDQAEQEQANLLFILVEGGIL